jgi:glyoxylase-like metal-dependent hydrolase (beta-lactamase superfamily II)
VSGEKTSVGNVTVQAIQDISTPARPELMFPMSTPESLEPFKHLINERGHFSINIGTFAVRSGDTLILVDTGIGNKNRAQYRNGALPENLRAAGIKPEDVDIVLITHLHIDHVGWNTIERDGAFVPFFPKARYVIQRREWEYWTQPEVAARNDCIGDSVLPLQNSGQLDLTEDVTAVTPEITTVPTPGHTPAHIGVAIVSGGERALIIGDVAHHPIQLTEVEWSIAFDLDPAQARETRRALVERVERERELVFGGHFPAPGFGRLVRLNGRRYWEALKPAAS